LIKTFTKIVLRYKLTKDKEGPVKIFILFLVAAGVVFAQDSHSQLLNPDFPIATPAGNQVFREELAIALTKTTGATPETRKKFKHEAEQLAQQLFHKGQKEYKLEHINLVVRWELHRPVDVALSQIENVNSYIVTLNEILFFTYHEDHLSSVIPHEVAHLLHYERYGNADSFHSNTFRWILEFLVPKHEEKFLDPAPACRLYARLQEADGVAVESFSACKK